MVVLGIDPGIGRMGYGILGKFEIRNSKFETLGFGCIETQKGLPIEVRLLEIHEKLSELIEQYHQRGNSGIKMKTLNIFGNFLNCFMN